MHATEGCYLISHLFLNVNQFILFFWQQGAREDCFLGKRRGNKGEGWRESGVWGTAEKKWVKGQNSMQKGESGTSEHMLCLPHNLGRSSLGARASSVPTNCPLRPFHQLSSDKHYFRRETVLLTGPKCDSEKSQGCEIISFSWGVKPAFCAMRLQQGWSI